MSYPGCHVELPHGAAPAHLMGVQDVYMSAGAVQVKPVIGL